MYLSSIYRSLLSIFSDSGPLSVLLVMIDGVWSDWWVVPLLIRPRKLSQLPITLHNSFLREKEFSEDWFNPWFYWHLSAFTWLHILLYPWRTGCAWKTYRDSLEKGSSLPRFLAWWPTSLFTGGSLWWEIDERGRERGEGGRLVMYLWWTRTTHSEAKPSHLSWLPLSARQSSNRIS